MDDDCEGESALTCICFPRPSRCFLEEAAGIHGFVWYKVDIHGFVWSKAGIHGFVWRYSWFCLV